MKTHDEEELKVLAMLEKEPLPGKELPITPLGRLYRKGMVEPFITRGAGIWWRLAKKK